METKEVAAEPAKKPAGKAKVAVPRLDLVSVAQLEEDAENPRKDFGDIKGLAASIANNGLKVALRVRDSGKKLEGKEQLPIYIVTAGNRRLRAIKSLGGAFKKTLIKVEIEPEGYEDIKRLYDHLTTNDGLNLNMLELADLFQQIRATGMTDAEIARQAGKSQMHVHDCLLLWDGTSEELKAKIRKGKISPTAVVETLKAEKDKAAEVLAKAEQIAGEDKKVTGKHITEAQGKAAGSKINNTSSKPTKVIKEDEREARTGSPNKPEKEEAGEDKSLGKLTNLLEALEEEDGIKNEAAFEALRGIVKWLNKGMTVIELSKLFFTEEAES